jgi:hypothetical protein
MRPPEMLPNPRSFSRARAAWGRRSGRRSGSYCLLDGSGAGPDVSIVMIPNVIIGYHSCSNALL